MTTGIALPPRTQVGSTLALGALIDQVTCRNTGLASSDGNLAFHTRLAPWGEHSPRTQAWGRILLPDHRPPLRSSVHEERMQTVALTPWDHPEVSTDCVLSVGYTNTGRCSIHNRYY